MSKDKVTETEVRFREAAQRDVAFIFNSWLKSYRSYVANTAMSNAVYFAQHHVLIEGICKTANITIACAPDDATQIYGYIVHQVIEGAKTVHFLYVKESYRSLGLAKLLLRHCGIEPTEPFFISHRTRCMRLIELRYPIVYNPYLAYPAYAIGRQAAKEAKDEQES